MNGFVIDCIPFYLLWQLQMNKQDWWSLNVTTNTTSRNISLYQIVGWLLHGLFVYSMPLFQWNSNHLDEQSIFHLSCHESGNHSRVFVEFAFSRWSKSFCFVTSPESYGILLSWNSKITPSILFIFAKQNSVKWVQESDGYRDPISTVATRNESEWKKGERDRKTRWVGSSFFLSYLRLDLRSTTLVQLA